MILTAFATVMLICSCDVETSGNGKLDGMWHLVSIDTLSTGGTRNMADDKIFWSFQNKLLELDDKSGVHNSILFRFELSGRNLKLYSPYIYDRLTGDIPLTEVILLMPFGINQTEETFAIEKLNGSKLILNSDDLQLTLKKF